MARDTDPMLDLLLARLAEKVGDLARHINRERVAADLALARWAAERENHIGVTPQERREVAEAVQLCEALRCASTSESPARTAHSAPTFPAT